MASDYLLQCGARTLALSAPVVMGVLNVTPDSFSDGGKYVQRDAALAQARRMVEEGASIIDIGGESTRPGAAPVTVEQELERVVPVVEAIAAELDVVISLDTSTPDVMREGARAGAGLINDVRALTRPGALAAAVDTGLAVCLMHMNGEPGVMQQQPSYPDDDVISAVENYLRERVEACLAAGIPRQRLVIDPGFGFGKTLAHNLRLLREMNRLQAFELPILAGMSRKSMIGHALGRPVDQRLAAGLALHVMAFERGAHIIRAHDVRETADALNIAQAVLSA
ncbi:dihydropteroate synthase [Alcanivorax quisquiliarum]|uniref:Dihydropteroate synthase n=1 Tax=Alcanivorax quisquiliarum TaxID=2933565 RepID=A0ABT0E881_9GAMM|nr:dihydropteroate synthase [Alcanivorax quisquiliarum]MCK0538048.1 dihydropteroate synthase [Alcanivorax quisquiliarum]